VSISNNFIHAHKSSIAATAPMLIIAQNKNMCYVHRINSKRDEGRAANSTHVCISRRRAVLGRLVCVIKRFEIGNNLETHSETTFRRIINRFLRQSVLVERLIWAVRQFLRVSTLAVTNNYFFLFTRWFSPSPFLWSATKVSLVASTLKIQINFTLFISSLSK
jgi:hypothetical protein